MQPDNTTAKVPPHRTPQDRWRVKLMEAAQEGESAEVGTSDKLCTHTQLCIMTVVDMLTKF